MRQRKRKALGRALQLGRPEADEADLRVCRLRCLRRFLEDRINSRRQVPGKYGGFGVAVEGLVADRLALQRRADDHGQGLAGLLHAALAGGANGRHGQHLDFRTGEVGALDGAVGQPAHDRLQPVVRLVVQVIGLRRGDEDAVDAAREEVGEEIAVSLPEAAQNLGQRPLEVGHGAGAGIHCLHGVDQHDLAVEPGDVLAKERLHHMRLVGLVAPLHHGMERAGAGAATLQLGKRGEGQGGRALEIARHQEAPGRQRRERALVELAGPQVGSQRVGQGARGGLVRVGGRIDGFGQGAPFARQLRPNRQFGHLEGVGGEFLVGLAEQRQVEQPFAGIVDNVDRQAAARKQPAPAGG